MVEGEAEGTVVAAGIGEDIECTAVDALHGEDTPGLDLDAEMADMREVSGGMEEYEAVRDAGAR